jgi:hypothetical protein
MRRARPVANLGDMLRLLPLIALNVVVLALPAVLAVAAHL